MFCMTNAWHINRNKVRPLFAAMIAVWRPAQQCVALNREGRLIECGKCAVGQLVEVASMQALGATS